MTGLELLALCLLFAPLASALVGTAAREVLCWSNARSAIAGAVAFLLAPVTVPLAAAACTLLSLAVIGAAAAHALRRLPDAWRLTRRKELP